MLTSLLTTLSAINQTKKKRCGEVTLVNSDLNFFRYFIDFNNDLKISWGGLTWWLEWSSSNQNQGCWFDPHLPHDYADMSLNKILNPALDGSVGALHGSLNHRVCVNG